MRTPEVVYLERLQKILNRLPLCYAEPIRTSLRNKITEFGYVPNYPRPIDTNPFNLIEGNENKLY